MNQILGLIILTLGFGLYQQSTEAKKVETELRAKLAWQAEHMVNEQSDCEERLQRCKRTCD